MGRLPEDYLRIPVPSSEPWYVWVLSDHYEAEVGAAGRCRTDLGELVYRAKYCDDRSALEDLKTRVRHCALQLRRLSPGTHALCDVTAVAAVPCNPPKLRSVPHEVVGAIASAFRVYDISASLAKVKVTPAAKFNPVHHPDAYRVDRRLDGERVLLVDDLFHTGTTLESVASQLRAAGADRVVGLCITRVHKGMTT